MSNVTQCHVSQHNRILEFSKSLPFVQVKHERNKRLISLKEEKHEFADAIRFNHAMFFFLKPLDMESNTALTANCSEKEETNTAAEFLATGCKAMQEKH